jgi:predicted ATPase
MRKIVFIEGISGVGKSTITNALHEKLRQQGYSANRFLEGDIDSPLDLFYAACLTKNEYRKVTNDYPEWVDELDQHSMVEPDYVITRYQDTKRCFYPHELHTFMRSREFCYKTSNPVPFTKYCEIFARLWRRFAMNAQLNTACSIFDGSLLHHQINDLLTVYQADEDEITVHIRSLLQAIETYQPIVFYLFSNNVGRRLAEARQSRGQTPPTDEQVGYWENRVHMDLSVLDKLPVESYRVDISDNGWGHALNKITSIIIQGRI